MAPALTETNQEDNFKLPHSPNSTTIINPAITQDNGDRFTCNIPFEISPKYHLANMCIGKSEAELNGYISAKDIFRLNGDSVVNGCNNFSDYEGENLEDNCKFSKKHSQGKNPSDVCELSKIVMQKLAHANVPFCHPKGDMIYSVNDKKPVDFSPSKINGESTKEIDVKKNGKTEPSSILEEKIKWDTVTKNLENLQGNTVKLMRQIRILQMQNIALHVSKEIGSFVSYGRTKLDKYQETFRKMKLMQKPPYSSNRFVSHVPTIALTQMKKKVHHMKEKPGILFQTSSQNEPISNDNIDGNSGKIDPSDCVEINRTVGTLLSNLKHLESSVDSDATESSSGGESCDEYEDIDDRRKAYQVPIYKRSVWKWAVSRAEVARRWIWLQAQIVDLEQRIRRLNALCQKFHSAKESYHSFHSEELEDNTNEKSHKLKGILSLDSNHKENHWIKSNGYNVQNNKTSSVSDISEHYLPGVSRTRPLKTFRKRKLYWLTDIHLTGTKAAKLSTVKCSCKSQENMISCILCSGQYNRILALDPDIMSIAERISKLESSYHSVLSFRQDIPLNFHFEMLLKKCKIGKQLGKSNITPNKRHLSSLSLSSSSSAFSLSSASSHHQKKRHKQAKRVAEMLFSSSGSAKKQKDQSQSLNSSPNNSRPCSPNLYSFTQDVVPNFSGRRRKESAFDINNIVIPCCIVPAIRVEKLQYKEILTPKWRIIENKNENTSLSNNSKDNIEDLSDEVFSIRHQKCEIKEKKWFMSYIRVRTYGRGRSRSLRFDVVPNSPQSLQGDQDLFSGCDNMLSTPYSPDVFSTISSSDMSLEEETKDSVADEETSDITEPWLSPIETFEIIKPYDLRTFPLSDEEYKSMLKEASESNIVRPPKFSLVENQSDSPTVHQNK